MIDTFWTFRDGDILVRVPRILAQYFMQGMKRALNLDVYESKSIDMNFLHRVVLVLQSFGTICSLVVDDFFIIAFSDRNTGTMVSNQYGL